MMVKPLANESATSKDTAWGQDSDKAPLNEYYLNQIKCSDTEKLKAHFDNSYTVSDMYGDQTKMGDQVEIDNYWEEM